MDYYSLIVMLVWHFSKTLEIDKNADHFEKVEKEVEKSHWPSVLWLDVLNAGDVFMHTLFFMLISVPAKFIVWGRVSRELSFRLTFISWQNAPAFLFMMSFAICPNMNVCVFKRSQIQQRPDLTGNTDCHVNIQSLIISIASIHFETDNCV